MDKLNKSFVIRAILYILMIVFITVTVLSSIVVITNISNHWYYKNKESVKQDIYSDISSLISYRMNDIVYYETYTEGDSDLTESVSTGEYNLFISDEELVKGESSSTQFGYTMYMIDEEKDDAQPEILRELNPQLGEQAGVFTDSIWHSEGIYIEIYLGDLENGGVPDEIDYIYGLFKAVYGYRTVAMAASIIGTIFSVVLFIILMCAAGRDREKRSFINKIPMDFLTVVLTLPMIFIMMISFDSEISFFNYKELIAAICAVTVAISIIVTCYMLVFAVQVKAGGWWRNTVIFKLLRMLKKIILIVAKTFGHVSLVWKTGLAVLAGIMINFIMMIQAINSYGSGGVLFIWFIGAIITAALIIYISLCMKRLQDGARHLAEGDMGYKVDKKGLFFDLEKYAESLNDISNGMSTVVEERLKSERFKTELITNVSHDIKTPITSIINYVDFLKKEDIDNEKAKEYIDVLDRQSQRLKKLTEDLVEASKAATGNVNIELLPCDAGVMMMQVMGEYKEKAEKERLEMIMRLPEENISIMADGRSMWRVFDNLLNNICKYSQPGTRVYQTLEKKAGKAVITYKNTSKYELNISGEELTERFVRGDSSRHTEGSGLGLSIARNLVELQGGSFEIYIDGDLFKVIIEFDLIS